MEDVFQAIALICARRLLFILKKIVVNFLPKDLMTPPPPPLGVENVKIRENSEKNQGTPGGP